MPWRIGGKIPLNVYENDKPRFQCHTPEEAARIVAILNLGEDAMGLVTRLERILTELHIQSVAIQSLPVAT